MKKVSNVKFGKLVDRLYRSKRLSLSQADNAKCQCNDLLQSVLCTKKSFQVRLQVIKLISFYVSLLKKV